MSLHLGASSMRQQVQSRRHALCRALALLRWDTWGTKERLRWVGAVPESMSDKD